MLWDLSISDRFFELLLEERSHQLDGGVPRERWWDFIEYAKARLAESMEKHLADEIKWWLEHYLEESAETELAMELTAEWEQPCTQ